jgi:genome maintenance exonuclease 1
MILKTFEHKSIEQLNFDLLTENIESNRFYVTPEGKKYKSVTTVLGEMNKAAIIQWRNRVGEQEANKISRLAARKGTSFHALVEKYLNNNLTHMEVSGIMHDIKQMFLRIKPVLDEKISTIYSIEQALYSDELELGGRVDLIADYDGILSIIDHKTASKPKKESWITNYFYQTAIYAKMVEERTGVLPKQIVILISVDDGYPQIFIKKTKDYLSNAIEFVQQYHAGKLL